MHFLGNVSRTLLMSYLLMHIDARTYTFSKRSCNDNPYCQIVDGEELWTNDCGLERPSVEGFEEHKEEITKFFEAFFEDYRAKLKDEKLDTDELTIPAFIAKRLAPNISPSAIICDGTSKCQIPSCENFGKLLTKKEQQYAWYIFEFISILDHTQAAMYSGTQDAFDILHWDVQRFAATFTYADELQTIAEMRKAHELMILSIIMSTTLLASAGTAAASSIMSAISATAGSVATAAYISQMAGQFAHVGRIAKGFGTISMQANTISKGAAALKDPIGAITNNAYIGIQNLVTTLDPIKDVEGFNNLLEAYEHSMSLMLVESLDRLSDDNKHLMTGGRTRNGLTLVDLFFMGNLQAPELGMSKWNRDMMVMYHTAVTINNLWQREGAYIVATRLKGESCFDDHRSHHRNRVCLSERPNVVYWIYAVGLDDKETITSPPGFWNLGTRPGYRELRLDDVVRSSLWKEEYWDIYGKKEEDPADALTILTKPIRIKKFPRERDLGDQEQRSGRIRDKPPPKGMNELKHYGIAPGTFTLPICRSWTGSAISSVNSEKSANAPCICDGHGRRSVVWSDPVSMFPTHRFLNNSGLFMNKKYGRMCLQHHNCKKNGKWRDKLHLKPGVRPLVTDAWSKCSNLYDHDDKGSQIE